MWAVIVLAAAAAATGSQALTAAVSAMVVVTAVVIIARGTADGRALPGWERLWWAVLAVAWSMLVFTRASTPGSLWAGFALGLFLGRVWLLKQRTPPGASNQATDTPV